MPKLLPCRNRRGFAWLGVAPEFTLLLVTTPAKTFTSLNPHYTKMQTRKSPGIAATFFALIASSAALHAGEADLKIPPLDKVSQPKHQQCVGIGRIYW